MDNKEDLPISITEKEKKKCPFYGFRGNLSYLIYSKGNQCALITKRHSPCHMEIEGLETNWNNCYFNNPQVRSGIDDIGGNVRVFREDLPEEISLKEWMDYVMKD